jgi:DNA repair protein RecO (recombination protein O)
MDYREADRIVTIYTREHGKLKCIARGAKRSMKRFCGGLELFARLETDLRLKEGLISLGSVDMLSIYPAIRTDLHKIAHAGYACELVERFLPEALPNARLFRLLAAYLKQLDDNPWDEADRRFFEVNLLNILGYRLPLEECPSCGAHLVENGGARLASASGTLLCRDCSRSGRSISSETLQLLARGMGTGRFGAIQFPLAQLHEAGLLLDAAIASHLDRPLRSLAFLQGVGE